MGRGHFEWDEEKDKVNQDKHHVSFAEAQHAFADPRRVIAKDLEHSQSEERFYLFWHGRQRCPDCSLHVSRQGHPHIRGWLLAQRQGYL